MREEQQQAAGFGELMAVLRADFATFSPQFQQGARYLMDHPDDVAVSSMRSIAAGAGVQSSTLVRLAQRLGFAGWPELREIFVARVRAVPEGYARKAASLARQTDSDGMVAEMFEAQRLNLTQTEAKNASQLAAVATLVAQARHVHVAGFRASHPIAHAFHYLYRLFRPSVTLLGSHGGGLEMDLRALEAGDVVVVASFAPYSSEARLVAAAAHATGCKLVAITDSLLAPIALHADATVPIAVQSPSFFPSMVAGVAAVESLVELLVSCHGADAVQRIEAAETQLFELGAYDPAGRTG
jgi:DNA-binding MurR/RpiR family transcriptional regulator